MNASAVVHGTRTEHLKVSREAGTAWIIIDRLEKRNALSPQMWAELPQMLRQLDEDPTVRVIGLRGAGKTFSAGADIAEVLDCLIDNGTGVPRGGLLTRAAQALAAVRKATVCVLEGYCMGGAWMLAQACDLRVAAESVRIGLTPSRIGIIYPEYGINMLVRMVGPAVASELLLTGDTITAAEARRCGMLTRVVAEEDLEHEVLDLCGRLERNSQLSVQAQKYLIAAAGENTGRPSGDQIIQDLFAQVAAGPDAHLGRLAFLGKQAPVFEWSGERFWSAPRK
ncbi:enoyl-CoA hydratase/isomerase family protein [Glutamicibacter sp. NPDC087344]|uniref:enoyl-CoA hydratase/isomerase family protein n=1 Tax=Glutamicibacter sp. NPDC087344 TaxID=3363994 RepID=UPI0038087EB3